MFERVSDADLEAKYQEFIANGLGYDDAGTKTFEYEQLHNTICIDGIYFEKPETIDDAVNMILKSMDCIDSNDCIILDRLDQQLEPFVDRTWMEIRDFIITDLSEDVEAIMSNLPNIIFEDSFDKVIRYKIPTPVENTILFSIISIVEDIIRKSIWRFVLNLKSNTIVTLRNTGNIYESYIAAALIGYSNIYNIQQSSVTTNTLPFYPQQECKPQTLPFHQQQEVCKQPLPCQVYIISTKDENPHVFKSTLNDLFNAGYNVNIVLNKPNDQLYTNNGHPLKFVDSIDELEAPINVLTVERLVNFVSNLIHNTKDQLIKEGKPAGTMDIINECDKFLAVDDVVICDDVLVNPDENDLKTYIRIMSKCNPQPIRIQCTSADLISNLNIADRAEVPIVSFKRVLPK